jgi:epoxide hydrolase-like predicted phosphatase
MASENGHYTGLLIDWGGVLTTSMFQTFSSFCALEGLEPDTVMHSFRHDRACRQLLIDLETGRMPEDEFEIRFAEMLGVQAPALIDRMFAASGPEQSMIDAVLRARQGGVRTGLISNSWGTRRYDREQLAQLFDGIVISGEIGIRKPAPEIYELGARQIGLAASACVFVDDLPFNLEPAAELGMATVHHVNSDQTIDELERLLGMPLR